MRIPICKSWIQEGELDQSFVSVRHTSPSVSRVPLQFDTLWPSVTPIALSVECFPGSTYLSLADSRHCGQSGPNWNKQVCVSLAGLSSLMRPSLPVSPSLLTHIGGCSSTTSASVSGIGKLSSNSFFSFQSNLVGPVFLSPSGKCHEQMRELNFGSQSLLLHRKIIKS